MKGVEKAIEHVASARRHLSRLLDQRRIEDSDVVKNVLSQLADNQMDLEETNAASSESGKEEVGSKV